MKSSLFTHARPVMVFAVIAATLVGYNIMSAQTWIDPTGTPPANNTPAPINVGSTTQSKAGALAASILAATTEVRSDRYCDAMGQNCMNFGSSSNQIELGIINGETYGQILTAQNLCTTNGFDGVWATLDQTGNEDIICFKSAIVGKISEVQTFVSAYYALRSDPSFATFWGSALPNFDLAFCGNPVTSLYRCGTGWKVVDPAVPVASDTQRIATYNKICSYMMENGRWKAGTSLGIFDSGSDGNNNAIYWNGNGSGILNHAWNDYHDATVMTCIGDKVSVQGDWWLKSKRSEAYGRSGNKYPAPPVR